MDGPPSRLELVTAVFATVLSLQQTIGDMRHTTEPMEGLDDAVHLQRDALHEVIVLILDDPVGLAMELPFDPWRATWLGHSMKYYGIPVAIQTTSKTESLFRAFRDLGVSVDVTEAMQATALANGISEVRPYQNDLGLE